LHNFQSGEELENDSENPCFGCGPNNPKGLRLHFFKSPRENSIFANIVFDSSYSAWPGQVHGGVIFAALECTCQWTFHTFKRQVGPTEQFKIEFVGRILIGEKSHLLGRVIKEEGDTVSVRAEIFQKGELCAFMDQDIRVVKSREEFQRLRPAVKFDEVMQRNFPVK
jgi:acyl-coenzyme A thioesterase PaaI-like protein